MTFRNKRSRLRSVNPRTILWQALVTAALLATVIAFADPATGAWLAGSGLVMAVALNLTYARALGRRGRSVRRMDGDRRVARHVAVGLALPLLIGIGLAIASHDPVATVWDFSSREVAAVVVSGAVLFVVILVSSLIDWYYIRPRIDAVVTEPPCRAKATAKGSWKRVTRRWYLHRGIATLAYIGFALTVAIVVMLMLVREHPAAAGVVGGVSGIAGLLLIFAGSYRSALPTVAQWVLSPAFVVGDDLTYEAHRWEGRGYVLHVSVPVVKLVPLDEAGTPTGASYRQPKTPDLESADLETRPTRACEGKCALLNPECLEEETEAKERRDRVSRWLIL